MTRTVAVFLVMAFVLSLGAVTRAKDAPKRLSDAHFIEAPNDAVLDIPADLMGLARPSFTSAVADTFKLGSWGFDSGGGNYQGWAAVDRTDQVKLYYHRADGVGSADGSNNDELNGGTSGNLLPLAGNWSMWCGQVASASNPWCGWATLPGYGNSWNQLLTWVGDAAADSVHITYKVFWDSEPGYDFTDLEYSGDGGETWTRLNVGQGMSYTAGRYDGTGPAPYLTETFDLGGLGSVNLRFHSTSDIAWSDEDGLWPTDGHILLDDITVETFTAGVSNGSSTADFETGNADWTPAKPTPFGQFGELYPGIGVLQEDPCFTDIGYVWQWVDDPLITNYACHAPDPRPDVPAMPFGGYAKGGLYLWNEIWSPEIDLAGTAGDQYILYFYVYRDLPLENLQFYIWSVRGFDANGCASPWDTDNFNMGLHYGGQKDWLYASTQIGAYIPPGSVKIQVAIGALDGCSLWCNLFGIYGTCHSHAPVIDDILVQRVNVRGVQFVIRHINLFQDNFAEDGTLTGTARADAAIDILPGSNGNILPGDSMAITVTGLGDHPGPGGGKALYLYAAVWPQGQVVKAGVNLEAPETRAGAGPGGKRFPLVGSVVGPSGATWYCFRFDSTFTSSGGTVADGYCVDLNDDVFTPGDTVCYVVCGDDGGGHVQYWSRRLNGQGGNFVTSDASEALSSPCEFTILPAGGYLRGGNWLYVDDSDDRGGPAELFVDTTLDMLRLRDSVDRYDVLGPSSAVGNSLASRVKNVAVQLQDCYRVILWISGNLSTGLVGDGGTANGGGGIEKSDDFALLFQFVDQDYDNPGVYFAGDDIASNWANILTGAGAVNFRSTYMNFNLDPAGGAPPADNSHIVAGEPVSPVLTGVGSAFLGDQLVAYGGCPAINDFDLLLPTGVGYSQAEMQSGSGRTYVLSQATPNSAGSTARVILSGFSYNYVRDLGGPVAVPARVMHLEHILQYFITFVPGPTGIDSQSYENALENNHPNPFNPTTTIAYSIKDAGNVTLTVYNAAGQLVRTLVNQNQVPRERGFSVEWDGKNNLGQPVSSGVYFYKLTATDFSQTKKMVLLK